MSELLTGPTLVWVIYDSWMWSQHLLGGLMQLFYSDPYGLVQVYGSSSGGKITIHTCIEDHQFQPQNFW